MSIFKIIFYIGSFFLLINLSYANTLDFKILEDKKLPNHLGKFKQLEFMIEDKTLQIYSIILDQYKASIQQQTSSSSIFAKSLATIATEQKAWIAINGGFYTPDFKPAGLFKEEGKIISKMSSRTILSSCVKVNERQIMIEKEAKHCLQANNAIQIGPLLIDHGLRSTKLNALQKIKLKSDFLENNRRTIIAESDTGKIILMVTTPVTLDQITDVLLTLPNAFGVNKIKSAVNLDGGLSSGMYIAPLEHSFYFPELRKVKTIIMINEVEQ